MNGVLLFAYHLVAGMVLFLAPSLLLHLKWSWTLFRKGSGRIGSSKWFEWLPFLGDGLQFFRTPEKFWDRLRARHGNLFLVNLFGKPTLMASTPETVKFVLQTHFKMFSPCYPRPVDLILRGTDPWEGEFHLRMRKVLQAPLLPESLRTKMASFDSLARWTINGWKDSKGPVNVHDETTKFSLHVALAAVCSVQPNDMTMRLLEKYLTIGKGLAVMPVNFPGFAFYRAMQAKKAIVQEMQQILDVRRKMRVVNKYNDILESFLLENSREGGQTFSDYEIQVSLFIILIAGEESTATLLAWVVKFLTENQDILQQVKEEQEAVRASKSSPDESLSWADIKKMPLSGRVILESLRLGNPVPLTPRVALTDVKHNGYIIPRGWNIYLNYRNVHMDPQVYPNPSKFDPSRFLEPPKPYTFIPFGGGSRYCLGNELVKIESLIFIHYLVTTCSWERFGQDQGVQYWPSPRPKGGFPITVVHKDPSSLTCHNPEPPVEPQKAAPGS